MTRKSVGSALSRGLDAPDARKSIVQAAKPRFKPTVLPPAQLRLVHDCFTMGVSSAASAPPRLNHPPCCLIDRRDILKAVDCIIPLHKAQLPTYLIIRRAAVQPVLTRVTPNGDATLMQSQIFLIFLH